MTNINIKKGFTLIELLVVIAIIGLLSSVVMVSLNTARSKARDAKRLSDLGQIQTALELYYHDNGHYPVPSGLCVSSSVADSSAHPTWVPGWNSLLSTTYIPSMPVDPINTGGKYGYYYCSSLVIYPPNPWQILATSANYLLTTRLENAYASPNYYPVAIGLMDNTFLNYLIQKGL